MIISQRKDSALLFHTLRRVTLITQQGATVCVPPSLHALPLCGLNAARQRAPSYGSDSNTGGNPQKGDSKDDALFTGQSGNHRPSQFQLISPSFHHTGPLRSLLSAYTKHRAELLTGGGKAVLARLLACRGWQPPGRIRRLIFSSASRFTSSPATVVLNNNLLSLWGDNCALDTPAGFLILSNELGQSPVLKSRTL